MHSIKELRKRLEEIAHLSSILNLLSWDRDVYMPAKGINRRSATIAELSTLIHTKFVSIDNNGLLTVLKKRVDQNKIRGKDAVIINETWRSFNKEKKLPEAFIRKLSETTSKAQDVWVEARKKNDFKLFLPWLTKIVELKRKEANYIGYKVSPYDALIDAFEPGMTAEEAYKVLSDLKDFLIPFIKNIQSTQTKRDPKILLGMYPLEKQIAFNHDVVSKVGFDLEAGRIDKTTHPFETSLHPEDVRLTTRFRENDVLYSLGSTIHEAGHGMYEQGFPVKEVGTPLAEPVSHGIHESQSRMWENVIGKGLPFWKYFYPRLQKEFPKPFKKIPLKTFYQVINNVSPSLIRTEADEVTYNLHIILRFEIEKEMIEGTINLKDLPKIWKTKMKEYFNIDVPTDALGVLQDVHWSAGLIGYFPSYSFGNLYSAQFYFAMKKAIPDIDKKIAKGDFREIKRWLNKNIHAHGKTYSADALVKKVTAEPLNSAYFIDYLKKKYASIAS